MKTLIKLTAFIILFTFRISAQTDTLLRFESKEKPITDSINEQEEFVYQTSGENVKDLGEFYARIKQDVFESKKVTHDLKREIKEGEITIIENVIIHQKRTVKIKISKENKK